jgi:hypothetical protein
MHTRLTSCAEHRLLATCAIGIATVVLQLTERRVIENATVLVPKRHSRRELSSGPYASQVVVTKLVPVAVQESKWSCEPTTWAALRVICHLFGEALAVGAVVAPITREALCMSLQSMSLFNLAAIRKSDVFYTKYVGFVVLVG